jgi:hypothetical protein
LVHLWPPPCCSLSSILAPSIFFLMSNTSL